MKSAKMGLVFDTRFAYARAEVRGIIAYAREHGLPWVFSGGAESAATWRMLRAWRLDGLFGTLPRRLPGRWAQAVPVVMPLLPDPGGAARLDNDGIGRAAAEHLLARGFRHLAFVGERGATWAAERGEGFRARWRLALGGAAAAGFHQLVLAFERGLEWRADLAELAPWLRSLPKPVGILAARDLRAREVLQTCRSCGFPVPEAVAVVGVDNDDLLCELSDPPLSSVSVSWEQIGRHMAERMHRRLEGRPPPDPAPLVRPGEVVVRRSSDTYATADESVVNACRHIRAHAREGLTIDMVARAVSLSRRGLERRFRKELGCSPRREIERVRLEVAQRLLRETPLGVEAIAAQSGFPSWQRLIATCKRATGLTPRRYRSRHQSPSRCVAYGRVGLSVEASVVRRHSPRRRNRTPACAARR